MPAAFFIASVFGAILDRSRGGHFSVGMNDRHSCTRRYVEDTNVLQTTLRAASGAACIRDSMPIPQCTRLEPMREVLRRLECVEGNVKLRVETVPRPDYGRRNGRLERRGPGNWAWTWGSDWMRLASDCELQPSGNVLVGEVAMQAGQQLWLSLGYAKGDIGNCGDSDAQIEISVYFADREPAGPFRLTVPARRTRHLRFNDLSEPEIIPRATDFASIIRADVPVVIQHTRLDSRQPALALMSTVAFPGR